MKTIKKCGIVNGNIYISVETRHPIKSIKPVVSDDNLLSTPGFTQLNKNTIIGRDMDGNMTAYTF